MRPLLIAVAILLALQGIAAASGQAAPTVPPHPPPPRPPSESTEVTVQQLALAGPAPFWQDGVVHDATLVTTVRNTGNTPAGGYSLAYQWRGADGATSWLDGTQQESTDVDTQGSLAPNATRQHTFPWHPQDGQRGDGEVTVTVSLSGKTSVATLDLFVKAHALTATLPAGNLTLAINESGFFRVTARNDGNVVEPLDLAVTDPLRGSNGRLHTDLLPAHLDVPPAGTTSADLVLDYPFVDSGNFTANFTVRVAGPGAVAPFLLKTPTVFGHDCCAAAGPPFRAALLGADLFTLSPGESLRIPVRMANLAATGSGLRDTYRVAGVAPEGFAIQVDRPRVALAEGQAAWVNVTVTVPSNAAEGSSAAVAVDATPGHGVVQRLPVTVQVRGAAFAVQAVQVDADRVYVGDAAAATVTVANVGNQDSGNPGVIHVTTALPGAAPVAFDVPLPPIAAGATVPVPIALGPLAATGQATVGACWRRAGDATECSAREATFDARRFAIEVDAPPGLAGQPGEGVSYQGAGHAFKVTNHGAQAQGVVLLPLAAAGTVRLADQGILVLGPHQSVSVPLVHVLPLPAGHRTGAALQLSAVAPNRPDLEAANATETAVLDLRAPTLAPLPVPGNWSRGEPLLVGTAADDDGAVEAANATVTDAHGNATSQRLARDANGDWTSIVVFAQDGEYDVSVEATDAAGNLAQATAGHVHVASYAPPSLFLPEGAAAAATRNSTLRIQVAGGHPVATLLVRLEGGEALPVNVTDGVAVLRLADLRGLHAGRQDVSVEAVDSVGARASLSFAITLPDDTPAATVAATHRATPWGPMLAPLALALALAARRRR